MVRFWIKINGAKRDHDIGVSFDVDPKKGPDVEGALAELGRWKKQAVIDSAMMMSPGSNILGEFNVN